MKKLPFLLVIEVTVGLVSLLGFPLDVCASEAGNESFSIPLTENKWNLISIPYDLPDDRVEAVLGSAIDSVDTIYTYDAGEWYVFRVGHPELSTLKTMQPGYGYFVHASSSASISSRGTLLVGSSTPPLRHLVSGWNLVGALVPMADHFYDIDEVFSSIGFSGVDYLTLLGMDTTTESFTTKSAVRQGDAFWMLLDAPHLYAPASF